MLDVKIKGWEELQKALDELPKKIEANIVKSALRQAVKVVALEAKRQVPVGTGALRASIRYGVDRKKETRMPFGYVKAGPSEEGDEPKGKKTAFYAHMVEFGTQAHVIRAKNSRALAVGVDVVHHPGSKARPFMRPAFDATRQAALQAFANQVKKRLTKAGIETPDLSADE